MKVKIGNRIYYSKDQPIMIILEDHNKEHINNMNKDCKKYCEYPDYITDEEIKKFMKVD